ncbi:TlyA family RNA methyltransferase [Luteococcus sp.]|uniref:TlyA family RNA methyltransferase n=1 Tax=Luteococcus sp. TaxID=1969402 RepID=UPI003736DB23
MADHDRTRTNRLDLELVDRGLARSRSLARKLVEQGIVQVDGRAATKASQSVPKDCEITLDEHTAWVSRAAHKLLGALDELGWDRVPERTLDAGASTGGFTEVLLSRGAVEVHAVDVGHGQMAQSLLDDPRVVAHEGLNLRHLALADVGGRPVDLAVCDVSFISLTLLLEPIFSVIAPGGKALLMVKPQFEVGRRRLSSAGVVRDEQTRLEAVEAVCAAARELGWTDRWRSPSTLPGPAGNIEYFVLFERV